MEAQRAIKTQQKYEAKKDDFKHIFPVVCYGCETWIFNFAIVKQLNSFEMWCYSRILKIKWTDMVTNKVVLSRMEQVGPCLTTELFKGKMECPGYVIQSYSETTYDEIIEGYIHAKRDKGRQRRTWTDDLKDWTEIITIYILKTNSRRQNEMEVHGFQHLFRKWHQMMMINFSELLRRS